MGVFFLYLPVISKSTTPILKRSWHLWMEKKQRNNFTNRWRMSHTFLGLKDGLNPGNTLYIIQEQHVTRRERLWTMIFVRRCFKSRSFKTKAVLSLLAELSSFEIYFSFRYYILMPVYISFKVCIFQCIPCSSLTDFKFRLWYIAPDAPILNSTK